MIKPIEGYEDYFVSDQGEVFSNKTGKLKKLKFLNNGADYVSVRLYKDKIFKGCYVHRLVAQAFVPNPENKPCVNHLNGIHSDNRAKNLEWCTHQENNQYFLNIQKPNEMYSPTSKQVKDYQKQYAEQHREEIKQKDKKYRDEHNETIKEKAARFRNKHREEIKEYARKYYQQHREEILERARQRNQEKGKM